jgi:hypothetical protein
VKRATKPKKRNLIGQKVQRIRMAALPRITQEDLAGRLARHGLQLSQPQIAKVENGVRPIFDLEVPAFAKALKVKIEVLFES